MIRRLGNDPGILAQMTAVTGTRRRNSGVTESCVHKGSGAAMACLAGCRCRYVSNGLAHNPGILSAMAGCAATCDAGVVHFPAHESIGAGMASFTR